MDLDPGQPVFVKEVSGNVWKTTTVDQPAAEPDSYWVRFADNSILRRTRSMIKPRSLQPIEQGVNVACYTNGKCDHSSSQR